MSFPEKWPEAGEVFAVVYPFCRATFEWCGEDGPETRKVWRPGVSVEMTEWGDSDIWADGEGEMRLTVVDVHKPGRFPTRVFYTRQWIDPDDNAFGKGALHICTLEKFRRISKRYQVEYECDGPDVDEDEVQAA